MTASSRHRFNRRTLSAAVSLLCAGGATSFTHVLLAGPTGGQIVGGSGAISAPDSQTTIVDQATRRLAVDWETFNLSADELIRFNQPSSSAQVLNRIFDQNASEIFGQIKADGHVFLMNPNGVIFGKTAHIDVGSLTAASANIDKSDFMSGKFKFFSGDGFVVNRGVLNAARGGTVTLAGKSVKNEGLIIANYGRVNLASGDVMTLDFDGDGLIRFQIEKEVLENVAGQEQAVSNTGTINANGGEVLLSGAASKDVFSRVVNNEGMIRAGRIDTSGGKIQLIANGGDTYNSGVLDAAAKSSNTDGGMVHILGDRVAITEGAAINASGLGKGGGGEVLMGGDYRGENPAIKNSQATYIGSNLTVKADAGDRGDGGRIIAWSDGSAKVHGSLSARGGIDAGHGGLIETSGKYLDVSGVTIDAGASNGQAGEWLLDPIDITISTGASSNGSFSGNGTSIWAPNGTGSIVNNGTIETTLSGGTNVTITTATDNVSDTETGNITIASGTKIAVDNNSTTAPTLSLLANGSIVMQNNSAIQARDADDVVSVVFTADQDGVGGGNIQMYSGSSIATNGGDITFGGGSTAGATGTGTTAGTREGVYLDNATLNAGTGNITIEGTGASGAGNFNAGVYAFNSTALSVAGAGTIQITGTGGGTGTNNSGIHMENVTISAVNGSVSLTGAGATGGTSDNRGVLLSNTGIDITGTGAIQINGAAGGTTSGNYGVYLASTTLETNSGAITINGTGAGSSGGEGIHTGAASTTIKSATGNITLNATGNVSNAMNFSNAAAIQTTGNLNLIGAGGDIAGGQNLSMNIGGTTNITLGTGNTSFTNNANELNFLNITSAQDFAVNLTSGVILGTSTLTGNLTVNAGGDITDNGIVIVNGASKVAVFNANLGGANANIELDSASNNFIAANITANNATIRDVNGLDLGSSNVSNNLNITAGGAINDVGVLSVGGVATFNTTGALSLDSTSNNFNRLSIVQAGVTTINDANSLMIEQLNASGAVTINIDADSTDGAETLTLNGTLTATSITLDGEGTNDSLILGSAITDTTSWNITGVNSGTLNFTSGSNANATFTDFGNLTGGAGSDTFHLTSTSSSIENIDGSGGTNALNINGKGSGSQVNLGAGSASGVSSFTNISSFTGGGTGYTLLNASAGINTYNITGANSGNVSGVSFSGFGNLTGGAGSDLFHLTATGSSIENIDGSGGTNALSINGKGSGSQVNLGAGSASGISGGYTNISGFTGGGTGYTLFNASAGGDTYNITGGNGGNVSGFGFSGFGNLTGGAGDDTFHLTGTGSSIQNIDGSGGTNTLNVNGKGTGSQVNLGAGSASGVSGFANISSFVGGGTGYTLLNASAGGDTYNITGANSGNVSGFSFSGFGNLTGGAGSDIFQLTATGSSIENIDGSGGTNSLNIYGKGTGSQVNLGAGSASGVGGFTNIGIFGGGGTGYTLLNASAGGDTYNITGADSGNVSGVGFTGFGNLTGGAGDDTFHLTSAGSSIENIDGSGGTNTLDISGSADREIDLGNPSISGISGGYTNITSFAGGGTGYTLLNASAGGATYNITGANSGNVSGISFSGFGNLTGGAGDDTFHLTSAGSSIENIDGSGGTNTLNISGSADREIDLGNLSISGISGGYTNITSFAGGGTGYTLLNASAGGATYNITGANSGNVSGISFSGFGNLTGGAGDDTFHLTSTGSSIENINGSGGTDTLNINGKGSGSQVNLGAGSASGVGGFANISSFVGGGTGYTLLNASAGGDTYNITGANSGNVSGFSFSGFGNLTGGAHNDTFHLTATGSSIENIDGSGGVDTLNINGKGSGSQVNLGAGSASGVGGFTNISNFNGGGTGYTLLNASANGDTYNITGSNRGSVGSILFTNFGNLTGGAGSDTFHLTATGSSIENIDGSGGTDVLNISGKGSGSQVNLGAGSASGVGSFTSISSFAGGGTGYTLLNASAGGDTYNITGANSGNVSGISFSGFGNLTGGAGNDTFHLTGTGSSIENIDGSGGTNTLDISGSADREIDLGNLSISGISGGYTNISGFAGGGTGYTLLNASAGGDTYNITGANSGNVSGISFRGFGNLTGGAGSDTFHLTGAGSSIENIDGSGGTDILNINGKGSGSQVNLGAGSASGVGGFTNISSFVGGGTGYTLLNASAGGDTYNITGANNGNVSGFGFSGFGNLTGGAGSDTFHLTATGSSIENIDGSGGTNTLDISGSADREIDLGNPSISGISGGYTNITSFAGGGTGYTLLNASAGGDTYNITGANSGNVSGISFTGFGNLTGGAGDDTFHLTSAGSSIENIDGSGGTNTLDISGSSNREIDLGNPSISGISGGYTNISGFAGGGTGYTLLNASAGGDTYNITGANSGNVSGISFRGFGNLTGGAGSDTFHLTSTGSSIENIDGSGGTDTLNINGKGTGSQVNLGAGSASGVGGFTNISSFVGGGTGYTLLNASAGGDIYNITGANSGNVSGFGFSGFGNLTGGAHNDTFHLTATGSSIENIDGSGGVDTLNINGKGSGSQVNLGAGSASGVGGFTNISNFNGGGTGYTLLNASANGDTYNITGSNRGSVGSILFTNFGNLTGGAGSDTFHLTATGSSIENIDGSGGTDVLNISGKGSGSQVNLGAGSASGVGSFTSISSFAGGGTGYTLLNASAGGDTYNITGANSGNVSGISFSGFGNLTGGAGNDTFHLTGTGSSIENIDGSGGTNTLDISGSADREIDLGNLSISGISGGYTNISGFAGGGTGYTLLNASAGGDTYNITGANSGNVSGISFRGFGNLTGGAGSDTFHLTGAGSSIENIDGSGGTDILNINGKGSGSQVNLGAGSASGVGGFTNISSFVGGGTGYTLLNASAGGDTYNITGANNGNVSGFGFSGFGNLTGGAGSDTFHLTATGSSIENIDGSGGTDTLNINGKGSGSQVNLGAGSASGVSSFSSINSFVGGGTGYTLLNASAGGDTYNITGANSGNVSGFSFSGFGNLTGGAGNDIFYWNASGSLSGKLDGMAGSNTINIAHITGSNIVDLKNANITNATNILNGGNAGGFANVTVFHGEDTGGTANDTLIGFDVDSRWNITAINDGNITGATNNIMFDGFGNLQGGSSNDTFVLQNGAYIRGAIDGRSGTDIMDYTAYDTAVETTLDGSGAIDGYSGNITANNISQGFMNIDVFEFNSSVSNEFLGGSADAIWTIDDGTNRTYQLAGSSSTIIVNGLTTYNGGSGVDTFNIINVSNNDITLNGGAGDDVYNFASGAPNNTVNRISKVVTVDGQAGNNTMTLNDSGDTSDNTGTVTSTNITGLGMPGRIAYTNISGANIMLGTGNNTIAITSTLVNMMLTINGNAGNDAVIIGNSTSSLDTILGDIAFNAGSGSDTLTINDQSDATGNTYEINATVIQRAGAGNISYTGTSTEIININTGAASDTIRLSGAGSTDFRIMDNNTTDSDALNITASLTVTGDINIQNIESICDTGAARIGAAQLFITNASSAIGSSGNLLGTNVTNISITGTNNNAYINELDDIAIISAIVSNNLTISSAGDIIDTSGANITVAGVADFDTSGNVTLGDNTADTTNFGSAELTASNATLSEDSSTLINNANISNNLTISSAGDITDASGANITVTGVADFDTSSNVTLGDNAADIINFGSVELTASNATLSEDSSTLINNANISNSLTISSSGDITDASGANITVTGVADFDTSGSVTLGDNTADIINFGSVELAAGSATINEDSDMLINNANISNSLTVSSVGDITDASGANITVTGAADFNASGSVTLGDNTADTTNFGSVELTASNATLSEDSSTLINNANINNNLTISSAGDITDTSSASITVTGVADFDTSGNVTLGDNTADTTNFGSVELTAGNATLSEDSDMLINNANISNNLTISSAGDITDASGANITVTGVADFNTSGSMTLGDNAADITNFGSVELTAGNATLSEDSSTLINNANISNNLTLSSAGDITAGTNAMIRIAGATRLTAAAQNITLDQATNDFVGNITVVNAGNVTIVDANDIFSDSISISGDLNLTTPAGSGITLANVRVNNGQNVTLNTDNVDFIGSAGSIRTSLAAPTSTVGSSEFVIAPVTAGLTIGLGDTASCGNSNCNMLINYSATGQSGEWAAFADGWGNITIGDTDSRIYDDRNNPLFIRDPLNLKGVVAVAANHTFSTRSAVNSAYIDNPGSFDVEGTTLLSSVNISASYFNFDDVIVAGPSSITATSGNITISGRISSEAGENNDLIMNTTAGGHVIFEGDIGSAFSVANGQISASHMGQFRITGDTSISNVIINSNNVSAAGFNITASNLMIGNDGSHVNPTTTNVAGTGATNVILDGASGSGDLITSYLDLSDGMNFTLTGNVSISSDGSDIDFNSTNNDVNGNYDLSLDVGTGNNITLGSVGGSTALSNFTVSAGNTTLNSSMTTNGAGGINLAEAGEIMIGSDIEINAAGNGATSLMGNVTTNDNNLTFGGDVNLTQSTLIDGGNGTITFGTATGDNVTISDNLTVSAAEVDFRGGTNSVSGGNNVTLRPNDANMSMNIGGAVDTTENIFEISDTDLDALGQSANGTSRGWNNLTLGRPDSVGGGNFSSTDYVFNDPVTLVHYNNIAAVPVVIDNVTSNVTVTPSSIFTAADNVTINIGGNQLNWYLDARIAGSLTINSDADAAINLGDGSFAVGSDINATTISFGNGPLTVNQDTVLIADSTIGFPSSVSGEGNLALVPRTTGIAVSLNGGAAFNVNTAAFTGLTGGLIIGGTVLDAEGNLVVDSFDSALLQMNQTALSETINIAGPVTLENTNLVLLSDGDITINDIKANNVTLLAQNGNIFNQEGEIGQKIEATAVNLIARQNVGTLQSAIQILVPNGLQFAQIATERAIEVFINNLGGGVASAPESLTANTLAASFGLDPNLNVLVVNTASLFAGSQVKSSLDEVTFVDVSLFDDSIELFGRQEPAVEIPEEQKEDYLPDDILDDLDPPPSTTEPSDDGSLAEPSTPSDDDPLAEPSTLPDDPLADLPLLDDPPDTDSSPEVSDDPADAINRIDPVDETGSEQKDDEKLIEDLIKDQEIPDIKDDGCTEGLIRVDGICVLDAASQYKLGIEKTIAEWSPVRTEVYMRKSLDDWGVRVRYASRDSGKKT